MTSKQCPDIAFSLSGGPRAECGGRLVEAELIMAGATGVRRLKREADFDRVEAIHREGAHAAPKLGTGENRFVFTRTSLQTSHGR